MANHERHTITDVLGTGLDTVKQNTSGYYLHVYGSLSIKLSAAGDAAYVDIYTNASNPPTTLAQSVGFNSLGTDLNAELYLPFSFVVQPNHYYLLTSNTSAAGAIGLHTMFEYEE